MALSCYAAARNKLHILGVLKDTLSTMRSRIGDRTANIVEVASGIGEHAALFAADLDNVRFQPTEPETDKMASIEAWCAGLSNVLPPLNLEANQLNRAALPSEEMKSSGVDLMVCINMVHISPFQCTHDLFKASGSLLNPGGVLVLYGPYRVNGTMVESNVAFDESLKGRNPDWGVRDLEAVADVAVANSMALRRTVEMPANNLCVLFTRS